MYKMCPNPLNNTILWVLRESDKLNIPFAPDNTDYQQFKIDLANGAQLSDANNNIMTANQISAFISTLP